jgi:hypothetical protein
VKVNIGNMQLTPLNRKSCCQSVLVGLGGEDTSSVAASWLVEQALVGCCSEKTGAAICQSRADEAHVTWHMALTFCGPGSHPPDRTLLVLTGSHPLCQAPHPAPWASQTGHYGAPCGSHCPGSHLCSQAPRTL